MVLPPTMFWAHPFWPKSTCFLSLRISLSHSLTSSHVRSLSWLFLPSVSIMSFWWLLLFSIEMLILLVVIFWALTMCQEDTRCDRLSVLSLHWCPLLIHKTCGYVILHGKRDFADMGNYTWLCGWAKCNQKGPLKSQPGGSVKTAEGKTEKRGSNNDWKMLHCWFWRWGRSYNPKNIGNF